MMAQYRILEYRQPDYRSYYMIQVLTQQKRGSIFCPDIVDEWKFVCEDGHEQRYRGGVVVSEYVHALTSLHAAQKKIDGWLVDNPIEDTGPIIHYYSGMKNKV